MNGKWMRDELEMNKKQTQMSRKSLFTTPPQKLTPQKLDYLFTLSFIAHFGEGSRFTPLQIAS